MTTKMTMSDCRHSVLVQLGGMLHESGKDYLCQKCGQMFTVELKTVTVSYPEAKTATR